MLTRRSLLKQSAVVTGGLATFRHVSALGSPTKISLSLSKSEPVHVPEDFMGLGYEMSSVAMPNLLSPHNARYVQLLKNLAPKGVLRVGGIVADYTRYERNGSPIAEPKNTVINRERLGHFNEFLKDIGWKTIWSLNFAQGTVEQAVAEAREVANVLGPRLLALEIGNEVENYFRGDHPFRKAPYSYETYRAEYTAWREAILKAVPNARFAAPDTASAVDWVESMAKDAHNDVQLLTTHYYRNGQQRGSAEQLIDPDPRLKEILVRLRNASKISGIPWRMCETNSFSGGGRLGVSDTFLGALWTLDFMMLLAMYGCAGVNIETGVNQLGFISRYSPIQDDGNGINRAGVPYYGMLAFASAKLGNNDIMQVDLHDANPQITAYAFGNAGRTRSVAVINKSTDNINVSVSDLGMKRPETLRLSAPSASSTTQVTFGGSAVSAEGIWNPSHAERVEGSNIAVPSMSAIVLRG